MGYLCLVEIPSTSQRKERWLSTEESTGSMSCHEVTPHDLSQLCWPTNRYNPQAQAWGLEGHSGCYLRKNFLGLGCCSMLELLPRVQVPSPAMQKPNRRQTAGDSLTFVADILSPRAVFSDYIFDLTIKMDT